MKTSRSLLIIGGAINAFFVLFHVWLGLRIHQLPKIDPALKSLLELLNGAGTLFILFLAIASWLVAREPSRTSLGRLVILLGATLYLLRGLSELFVPPHMTPAILISCVATGLVYAVALTADRRHAPTTASRPFAERLV